MYDEGTIVKLPARVHARLKAYALGRRISIVEAVARVLSDEWGPWTVPTVKPSRGIVCVGCGRFRSLEGHDCPGRGDMMSPTQPAAADPTIRCACCPSGCRRAFVWRRIRRCGCPLKPVTRQEE